MSETKLMSVECSGCGKGFQATSDRVGKLVGCPSCNVVTRLETPFEPTRECRRQAARPQESGGNDVAIKMGLPKVGSFETTVSRKDAKVLAHTFLGGLLVLMTVIVCVMFGVKPPNRG